MGKRRMICTDITRSDAFLDMPQSTRLLYYDLVQEGDDEGFVDNPKTIMRLTGATNDDMNILLSKKFVILPDEQKGVVVIKHWFIHNYIRKDRMTETNYKELKELLSFDENGSYTMATKCLPSDNQMSAQDKLSKDKLSKDNNNNKRFIKPTVEQIQEYIDSRHTNVDAERFFDYYESNGWKVGKNPMKDWKACVRTWEKNSGHTSQKQVDTLPTYDSSKNKQLSSKEENELLKLMGKEWYERIYWNLQRQIQINS